MNQHQDPGATRRRRVARIACLVMTAGIISPLASTALAKRSTISLKIPLFEVWETEQPDKRWAVLEYAIVGTKFDARFKFPKI